MSQQGKKHKIWSGGFTHWMKINGNVYIIDEDISFNAKEAADVLGISVGEILDCLSSGKIRVKRTGEDSIHFTIKTRTPM